jgi:hypothetical protein
MRYEPTPEPPESVDADQLTVTSRQSVGVADTFVGTLGAVVSTPEGVVALAVVE